MKRTTLAFLATILAACLLAACGGIPLASASETADGSNTVASTLESAPVKDSEVSADGQTSADASAAAYTVGASYVVEVPPELTAVEGAGETWNIYPQDKAWLLQLSTGYLGNKATVEEFAAGWALTMEDLTPCAIGQTQGYRYDWTNDAGVCTGVWFMFESLGDEGTPLGTITFSSEDATDLIALLDDPSVNYILDSIRAPE